MHVKRFIYKDSKNVGISKCERQGKSLISPSFSSCYLMPRGTCWRVGGRGKAGLSSGLPGQWVQWDVTPDEGLHEGSPRCGGNALRGRAGDGDQERGPGGDTAEPDRERAPHPPARAAFG